MQLPAPPRDDPEGAARWVARHLGDLVPDVARPSPAFRGGQTAADAALAAFAVRGYAGRRNAVWPAEGRGASRLSPYIRHGLLSLPEVWRRAGEGPARDARKYRDELLWQEYARHLYARLGARLGAPLRADPPTARAEGRDDPWRRDMACMDAAVGELERDGWVVNQARMWLASQWSVREGRDWREGERRLYRNLLDGSRAANALGWQWVVGTATGRPYGFARAQVERRAPQLCASCALERCCPIAEYPERAWPARRPPPEGLARDRDSEATGGPREPQVTGRPEAVWLTAESLGDADPALRAHEDLPAVFVFDAPALARMRVSGMRLVFLAETLGELAARRPLQVLRGAPARLLAGRPLAVTHTPVPGFARRAARLDIVARHPWPWLCRPHAGDARSYSAWVRKVAPPPEVPGSLTLFDA